MAGGITKWIMLRLFFSLAVFSSASFADSQYDSRLWKVKSLTQTSYLLGTMHVSDKAVVRIPKHLDLIINSAKILALEVSMDERNVEALRRSFVLRDGESLRSIIGANLYQKVSTAFLQRGYGVLNINEFKPWAVSLLLNFPPSNGGVVLDKKLHNLFNAQNKTVVGLESLDEQTQYFEKMSDKEQVAFLTESLNNLDSYEASMRVMKRLYLNGDLSALQRFSEQQTGEVESESVKQLMVDLIDTRNKLMLDRMQAVLAKGDALIAVGALHLPGEAGLIELLRNKGYQVTPVYLD